MDRFFNNRLTFFSSFQCEQSFLKIHEGIFRNDCSVFFQKGHVKKSKVKFEVNENATPIFRPKRSAPFGTSDPVNKELERRECLVVISRDVNFEWEASNIYVKKKNNRICLFADFSTGRCSPSEFTFICKTLQIQHISALSYHKIEWTGGTLCWHVQKRS